jgi:flagellar motility protein MotE (MotC chaperone)
VKLAKFPRRLRLIPAVMTLSAALLAVKCAGLVMEARAQEQQQAPPAPATESVASDPVADEPDTSSAQVDVLTSLGKRRAELDARERDLEMRENLLTAAEKRVDDKIDSLKQMQGQIQALLVQRDAAEQKQLDALVKSYSSMKPKDAARIFNDLNADVLLAVASQMKPDVLGTILSQMQADAAEKLTLRLANRLKLPDTQSMLQTTPQQMAAVAPVAAAGELPPAATPAAPATTPPGTAPVAAAGTPAAAAAAKTPPAAPTPGK